MLANKVLRLINGTRVRFWDIAHGVDTCGEIELANFDFQHPYKDPGLAYHSHHPKIIRAALSALNIRFEDYTFIDYGCGKGRVVLLALQYPFRKVIGFDFSPQLLQIAKRNLGKYRGGKQLSKAELLVADAMEFDLPPGPLVLYFYQPFHAPVMERVLHNLEASVKREPRKVFVLYSGNQSRDKIFGRREGYTRLRRDRYMDLYACVPA